MVKAPCLIFFFFRKLKIIILFLRSLLAYYSIISDLLAYHSIISDGIIIACLLIIRFIVHYNTSPDNNIIIYNPRLGWFECETMCVTNRTFFPYENYNTYI